jgi:hypothetical protein
MDFMINQIIGILIFLIGFGVYLYLKKMIVPKIKGFLGEMKVSLRLELLSKNDYIVLNDLLLKVGDVTTQIDHVVISKSGIFVIETKNFKGWIHGHENSDYWKQTIFSRGFRFKNPIKQNKAHQYALRKVLSEFPQIKYFPIVVFSQKAVLKNVTHWSPVIYSNQLIQTIRSYNKDSILSFDQMQSILDQLNRVRLRGGKENRNHVKQVRKRIREKRMNSSSKICPSCGHVLVKRTGKYGQFYGCSNFPKCKHSEKIVKLNNPGSF